MRPMLRALVVLMLVGVLSLVLAGVAYAQAEAAGSVPALDLFDKAQLIAFVGGWVLPLAVALLTKLRASGLVKSIVALVCAGLLALGTYLTDTGGATTWEGAVSVFAIAIVVAGATRYAVTGGLDDRLARATPNVGVG